MEICCWTPYKPKVLIFSCHRLDGFGCNLLKVDLYKLTSDLRHWWFRVYTSSTRWRRPWRHLC